MNTKFKHHAYVVITMVLSPVTRIPVFKRLGIYSSPAASLTIMTHNEIVADVFSVEGDSYHEAHEKIVEMMKMHPAYNWMLPHANPTREQHMAAIDGHKAVKASLEITDALYSTTKTGDMLKAWNIENQNKG